MQNGRLNLRDLRDLRDLCGKVFFLFLHTSRLASEPIGDLHQERVVRARAKEIPVITRRLERPLVAITLEPALRPHQEERRSRTIFPAQHRTGVELLLVEARQTPSY